MNLERFTSARGDAWNELAGLLAEAKRRPAKLGAARVRRLGALYRGAAADLAIARRRFPGDPVVTRLEALVGGARQLVYAAPARRESFLDFVRHGYWRLVLERPAALLASAVLLFAPVGLAGTWAVRDPGAAGGLVPSEYRSVTQPRPHGNDLGLSGGENAAMATGIFTNNIRVTFLAFAGGITLGLLTALSLLYNGVLLGTVGGLAVGAGNGRVFFELVTPHGVLELSCIVVAGAAGLRLAWAIVEPGRLTRRASLAREARRTVLLVLGTAPWLVVAGLVEGFLTPAGLPFAATLAVGVALGVLYWTLVLVLGLRGAREPSPAGTP